MKDIYDRQDSKKKVSKDPASFDPKLISPTIAPIPPPPVKDLVQSQRSRFT